MLNLEFNDSDAINIVRNGFINLIWGMNALCLQLFGLCVGFTICLGNALFEAWDFCMDKSGRKRIIYDRKNNKEPYLIRYYILFVNRDDTYPFNIFIHKFIKSDLDDIHDHPWGYFTYILKGGYTQYFVNEDNNI